MLSDEDKAIASIYGSENITKVKRNLNNGRVEAKKRFLEKYPYATLSKFSFEVSLGTHGDIEGYETFYVIDEDTSYDITSTTFMSNEEWKKELYWQKPWGVGGTVQPYSENTTNMSLNNIKVYVTDTQFFNADLPELVITNKKNSNDYKDNPYLASLFAAYITTYSGGVSMEHLTYNAETPKVITSIARYHLYYHIRRFIRQPEKMSRYVTEQMKDIIERNRPVVYRWSKEFHNGEENVGYWVSRQPRGSVRNARAVMSKNGAGQIGISYERKRERIIRSTNDYKLFIAKKSNGLTKTGELLFQQSVESYIYCVLGAQASTRWSIVGRGAMSIQTQEVFRKLVGDTVVQNDQNVTISNMRKE